MNPRTIAIGDIHGCLAQGMTPGRHDSGKTVIAGHTSQKDGEILDLGHIKVIDTYCCGGGWLTALEVQTEEVWQADREGNMRRPR
jgi:serine/threonine protein phosphatase 1